MADISPADLKRMSERAAELFKPETPVFTVNLLWRAERVKYFQHMWEALSLYCDEAASHTTVLGLIPGVEQHRDLYLLQAHNIAMTAVFGSLHKHCQEFFVQGFLDAALRSACLTEECIPHLKGVDFGKDLEMADEVEERVQNSIGHTMVYVDNMLTGGMDNCLRAARRPDAITIQPGYADPRRKDTNTVGSVDVDPVQVPAKPHDEVDFAVDMMVGLQKASVDSKMKSDVHDFVAKRIILDKLPIWRANYFALEI